MSIYDSPVFVTANTHLSSVQSSDDEMSESTELDVFCNTFKQVDGLGKGGHAEVWACIRHGDVYDTVQHTYVQNRIRAVKISKNNYKEEMFNEIDVLKTLPEPQHRSVTRIEEHDVENGRWIVLPLFIGGNLDNFYVATGGNIPNAFPWHVLQQLGDALVWLHLEAKVVHSDLHPGNILVDFYQQDYPPFPNLIISDFGLAMVRSEDNESDWVMDHKKDLELLAYAAELATVDYGKEDINASPLEVHSDTQRKSIFNNDYNYQNWMERLDRHSDFQDSKMVRDVLLPLATGKRANRDFKDAIPVDFKNIINAGADKVQQLTFRIMDDEVRDLRQTSMIFPMHSTSVLRPSLDSQPLRSLSQARRDVPGEGEPSGGMGLQFPSSSPQLQHPYPGLKRRGTAGLEAIRDKRAKLELRMKDAEDSTTIAIEADKYGEIDPRKGRASAFARWEEARNRYIRMFAKSGRE